MAENEEQILTKEGKRQLEQELHHLINEVRPEVIEELKAARAQGDLSENADYDAARTRQADVEGEIKRIEALLNNCRVIDEDDNTGNEKVVKIGSTVTFHDNKLNQIHSRELFLTLLRSLKQFLNILLVKKLLLKLKPHIQLKFLILQNKKLF